MAVRVGLFGAGWAARAVHGPSLRDYRRRRGGIVLAGVCDVDAVRADEVRDAFGFERSYASVGDMLAGAGLDAAVVAVSIPQNARVAGACLKAGLPVLLEKPPGLSARRVVALDRAARAARGRAMVAFNRRWTPALVRLRELAAKAGPVHAVRCDMRRVRRTDPDFSTTAVHAVDALRFLAGRDYARLDITYGRCGPRGRATSYHVVGVMDGGIAVGLDVVPMAGMDLERYTVHAGGQTLIADLGHGKRADGLTVLADGKERCVKVKVPSAARHDVGGFYQEVAALLDAVRRGGALPGPTIADTVQSVAVMAALGKGRTRYRAE